MQRIKKVPQSSAVALLAMMEAALGSGVAPNSKVIFPNAEAVARKPINATKTATCIAC